MLTFMRKQREKLKWVLLFVIFVLAASMLVMFIPFGDNLSSLTGSVTSSDVADVGSESVTAVEFQTAFTNYLRSMQQNQQLSPEIIKAFGFDKQILNYLIGQKVIMSEARRLGLDVTDEELQQAIITNPAFQAGGSFIGLERYEEFLLQNDTNAERFEASLRSQLLSTKVHSFVTAGVTVGDKEAEEEYRRRNEKAILTYFVIDPAKLESRVPSLSDQDLQTYFDKNKARYNIPEKRKSKYAFVDMVKYRVEMKTDDAELRRYYDAHAEEYRLPERIAAQHILFKTEGKTPEQVETIRKKATDVLERAKKDEDFAKLAKEFSEDSSASRGGDLGEFEHGTKSPQFEQAAFSLGEGAISDLVITPDGFHIIKVTKRQEARLRPFDEIKGSMEPRLLGEKARDQAKQVAEEIALDLVATKDLNAAAMKHGATVRETALLEQSAAIPEFGPNAMEFQTKVFGMAKDQFGTALAVQNGFVVPQVTEIVAAHPASFDEVRAKVATDAKAEKTRELATETANKIRQQIEAGKTDLAPLAQSAGAEIKTSEKISRGASLPDFGSISERDQEIFSMPPGKAAPPVTLGAKSLVFAVKSRDEIKSDEMTKALPGLREEMLPAKKDRYFSAYVEELQKKMETAGAISINQSALDRVASSVLP